MYCFTIYLYITFIITRRGRVERNGLVSKSLSGARGMELDFERGAGFGEITMGRPFRKWN
jgi:hypothetical protein